MKDIPENRLGTSCLLVRAASVVVRRKACVIRLMRERCPGLQQMRLAERIVPNVGGTTGD